VDASLKEKLKCLVFIPIISRTYCDPKSFAWEHEFKAFVEQASKDKVGLKVKLPNGNVASRVLSVRIHDLDNEDVKCFEGVTDGVMRTLDFVFKTSSGVNRPLKSKEDHPGDNLNKTYYQDQINKVALAIKNIFRGLKGESMETAGEPKEFVSVIEKSITPEKSIIVLPFENISPDPDQEYFSDGLTEEIITDLSHIHNLLVISRSSAMTFKGTKKKTKEIASEVNVRYVLEGSVRKAGNNLRITAQLIDGINDSHIWAEIYSGTLDDIFDIQEKVSSSITSELKLKLSVEERNIILDRPIKDIQAFEYYLKAKQEINNFTESSITKSIGYLQRALDLEGDNSSIYAELAHAYYQFWNMGIRIEVSDLEKAQEFVRKAFELDSDSPGGHFVSGLLEVTGGDGRKCISHFKKVLHTSPNHSNALMWLTLVYSIQGIAKEFDQYFAKLSKVDPIAIMNILPVMLSIYTGNYQLAEQQSSHLGLDDFSLLTKTWALMYNRKGEEAYAEFEKVSEFGKSTYMFKATLAVINGYLKKDTEVKQLIDDEKFMLWAKRDFQYSLFVAEAYAVLNYKDNALNWVENSINHGFINYPLLNEYDPFLEQIRGEERFKKLMERVKYEWENFEV
jgi:non-specific serine/threonine protein kinase